MSLIVTVRTDEGIVMASDSRVTVSTKDQHAVHFSDTTYKTFVVGGRIGVSTCGDAHIKGKSIASWIQIFEDERFSDKWGLLMTAQNIASFFAGLGPSGCVTFHIAGYEKIGDTVIPVMYLVEVYDKDKTYISQPNTSPGARWDGMTETLTRLIKSCCLVRKEDAEPVTRIEVDAVDQDGNRTRVQRTDVRLIPGNSTFFNEAQIDFEFFTLQDAIDFAKYAIQTTIDTIKFKSEPLTVGEPIDILVIRSTGVKWIARKELHA